jgi:hypothetical protein
MQGAQGTVQSQIEASRYSPEGVEDDMNVTESGPSRVRAGPSGSGSGGGFGSGMQGMGEEVRTATMINNLANM